MAKEKLHLTPQEARVAHPTKPNLVAVLRKPTNVQKRIVQGAALSIRAQALSASGEQRPVNLMSQMVDLAEPVLRFCLKEVENDGVTTKVTPENFADVFDSMFSDDLVVTGIPLEITDAETHEIKTVDSALDFGAWLATIGLRDAFKPPDADPKESQPQ